MVYATALFALFEKANLKAGQSVLVHAGSGGVGHAAIHLCQARGIEVRFWGQGELSKESLSPRNIDILFFDYLNLTVHLRFDI